jgi:hypothetical protein
MKIGIKFQNVPVFFGRQPGCGPPVVFLMENLVREFQILAVGMKEACEVHLGWAWSQNF